MEPYVFCVPMTVLSEYRMPDRRVFRESFSETYRTIFSPLTLFFWVGTSLVCAMAAPFGTQLTMDLEKRLVYWFVIVSAAMVLGYGVRALGDALIGREKAVAFDLFAVVASTVILTPVVWSVSISDAFNFKANIPGIPLLGFYVFSVAAMVFVGRRLAPGFEPTNYGFLQSGERRTADYPRLLRRLPEEMRGAILRLSGNGHFVEVVTERGTVSLRMRLTDAMDEMDPVEGYCVHRSHWVTRAAMQRFERENAQKVYLLLSNGDRLPVSRKYRPKLELAGLID